MSAADMATTPSIPRLETQNPETATGFPDRCIVELMQDGRTMLTHHRFRWYGNGDYGIIIVPPLFVTDLASIPRPLWWIPGFSHTGKHQFAAIIHDYLYYTHEVPRAVADRIFFLGMRDCGVLLFHRWAMYLAVRMFGGCAWRSDRLRGAGVNRVLAQAPEHRLKLPPRGIEWLMLKLMGRV